MPPKSAKKPAKTPARDRSSLSASAIAVLDRQTMRKRIYRARNKANGKRTPTGAHRTRLSSRRVVALLASSKKKKAASRAKRGLAPTVDVVKSTLSHASVLNIVPAKTLEIQRHRNKNQSMSQQEFDRYGRSQRLNQW